MKNKSTHALLLVLVGGYILYTAYHLLDNMLSGIDDIPGGVAVAAIIVFFLAGAGVLAYAWKIWRDSKKEESQDNDQEEGLK